MHPFLNALMGGSLIGLAAVLLMRGTGRIMGASGIAFGVITDKDRRWRLSFILGTIFAIIPYRLMISDANPIGISNNYILLILGGALVGVGTALGSGCTSGHGICGISRMSMRSILATCTFLLSAIITVYLMRHVIGVV